MEIEAESFFPCLDLHLNLKLSSGVSLKTMNIFQSRLSLFCEIWFLNFHAIIVTSFPHKPHVQRTIRSSLQHFTSLHLIFHFTIGTFCWKRDGEMGSHCTTHFPSHWYSIHAPKQHFHFTISHCTKAENPICRGRGKEVNLIIISKHIKLTSNMTWYQVRGSTFHKSENLAVAMLGYEKKRESFFN